MLSVRKRCRDDADLVAKDDVAEDEVELVVKEDNKDDVSEEDLVVKDDVAGKEEDGLAEFVLSDEDEEDSEKDLAEFFVSDESDDERMRMRMRTRMKMRRRTRRMRRMKPASDIFAPGQGSWSHGCCGEECQSLVLVGYKKQKHGEDWDEAPTDLNLPTLWMVQCPTGKERELAVGLMQNSKVHDINNHDELLIRSAISLDHHNYIYVESGLERHVRKACKALDESYYATSKMTLVSIEDTIVVLGLDSKSGDLSRDATHENNGNAPSPALPSTPDGHKLMISSSSALYIPGGQPMSL